MKKTAKRKNYKEEYVRINGIEQYILHGEEKNDLPVLLFLHGGPGSAQSPLAYLLEETWGKIFSVVHWDQRGAGKTLTRNPDNYPTIDSMLDDLYQVIQYLKKYYNQEKIILLGHSWGSVLGTTFIRKYPDDIAYYIGVGQVISMRENEQVGYEKLRELAAKAQDKSTLKKLERIGQYPGEKLAMDPIFMKKCSKIRKLQGKYNLALKINLSFFIMILRSPIARFSDLKSYKHAFKANKNILENFLGGFDLNQEAANYKIPVYFILGDNDWQTPYTLAKDYFSKIDAPNKQVFLIPNAGHLTMIDQPELFTEALQQIANLDF
ncbi:MAG: alpha/beta hydrolase [Bacillota bacterium]|nr:alpha/beta hydrolase [Bacillota bacterium]